MGRAPGPSRRWVDRMQFGDDVIARQALFSVYVHTAPGFEFAPSNLFHGYQIADRTVVQWGQFSVVRFWPLAPALKLNTLNLPSTCFSFSKAFPPVLLHRSSPSYSFFSE